MTDMTTSAETMLSRLLERLLTAAEASLEAGDLEPARATAEEVVAGSRLSATIRAFSSSDQRRRRPTPVITSSRRKLSAFVLFVRP